jgi:uncharacterized protein YraI
MHTWIKLELRILLVLGFAGLIWLTPTWTLATAQQPTGNIPTVTGTPSGPSITVTSPDGANVRAGPSTYDYAILDKLPPEATAPAIGWSPAKEWIQIVDLAVPGGVGWVYAVNVKLSPGSSLPIVEPPPTATPRTTPTINPTFAAAFQVQTTPTRLPTFTQPPPVATLSFQTSTATGSRVPMGFVIFGLALAGILGALISYLRGR